jgi:hypothetical protein
MPLPTIDDSQVKWQSRGAMWSRCSYVHSQDIDACDEDGRATREGVQLQLGGRCSSTDLGRDRQIHWVNLMRGFRT